MVTALLSVEQHLAFLQEMTISQISSFLGQISFLVMFLHIL
jgi:hypothetical protein